MLKQEQGLIDAAREILSDFNRYGEVLQQGDNGEYGMESAIGRLNSALVAYDKEKKLYACESCSLAKTDVIWREQTEQFECGECYQVWRKEQGLSADPCESCRKCGETICGNDTEFHRCYESKR